MKTNQMMEVCFFGDKVRIEHKTAMGSLTDIFHIGNRMRYDDGKKPAGLTQFLERDATKEFIKATETVWGLQSGSAVLTKGRGRNQGTFAHLSVLIYAAEYLSPMFHAMVIKEFITNRLLEFRDESGDNFILLNHAISTHLDGITQQDFINVAMSIKNKIEPEKGSWNTATATQLRERAVLESKLYDALKLGFIRDKNHLLEVINKI